MLLPHFLVKSGLVAKLVSFSIGWGTPTGPSSPSPGPLASTASAWRAETSGGSARMLWSGIPWLGGTALPTIPFLPPVARGECPFADSGKTHPEFGNSGPSHRILEERSDSGLEAGGSGTVSWRPAGRPRKSVAKLVIARPEPPVARPHFSSAVTYEETAKKREKFADFGRL